MKKLKLCIVLGLMLVSHAVMACGPYYYHPSDYHLYRVLPPLWQPPTTVSFAQQNIALWAKQTGCRDTTAIRTAIYSGTLADREWLAGKGDDASNDFRKNAFVKRLKSKKDSEAITLLYRSKQYECLRNQMRSPWYYNSRVTNEASQIHSLYDEVAHSTPTRYADRNLFLMLKCAWAAMDDSTVVSTWQKYGKQLKGSLFYDEAEDYVARSLERLGRKTEADAIYIRQGKEEVSLDIASLRRSPNSKCFAQLLQGSLTELERGRAATTYGDELEKEHRTQAQQLLALAQQAMAMPEVRRKDMWRYAAACCLDYLHRPTEALTMLQEAESSDKFLRKSIRALTFYLRGQVDTIDDAFVDYAVGEVQWLVGEMEREYRALPADMQQLLARQNGTIDWSCESLMSKCYALSVLQRAMLDDETGLTYRMASMGYGIRALQMANVACNYIHKLTNNKVLKKLRTTTDSIYFTSCYRNIEKGAEYFYYAQTSPLDTIWGFCQEKYIFSSAYAYRHNSNDYSNGMFFLADTMCARTLEQYRQRMLHPQDDVDRWMNARSYTAGDYWQDIIGTHYMRERNYAAAVAHLRHVSPLYQRCMNIRFWRDPFCIDGTVSSHDSTRYKLHFAQRMDSLQRAMLTDADADRRGLAMLEYSIGLENSFDMCWYLTSYGKSCFADEDEWAKKYWSPECRLSILGSPYKKQADAAVSQLRSKALRTLRTDDARARYYARLGQLKTVVQCYTDTPTAQHYALVCDNWALYRKAQ